jgi:NADH:ubiquinone oxidoreductase subunit E|tara:strand:- start:2824 stop:3234 length:411 start_codon:yes stop_codon:yes gene_type:complete
MDNKYLLQELRKIQEKEGVISEEAMKKLSKKLDTPISQIYGVATFYAHLHTNKQGKYVIEICDSPSCYVNGSIDIIKYIEKKLKVRSGGTTKDGKFSLHICSCIGCCNEAPAMKINKKVYGKLTKEKIDSILYGLK